MPPTASELKPAPRCCCVLGTVADVTLLGSGHKAVLLRVALHAGVHEEMMLAPSHAARAARQLLEAAKACGESGRDVTVAELELAAIEPKPVRHPYSNTLPTIDYVGGLVQPSHTASREVIVRPPARVFCGLGSRISPDQIEAAWARYRAGEAPVHILAKELGCADRTLAAAFLRTHGPEFQLIRTVYRDPFQGASETKRRIDQILGTERLPVTKPNGKLL
jgi:hypothetical protein